MVEEKKLIFQSAKEEKKDDFKEFRKLAKKMGMSKEEIASKIKNKKSEKQSTSSFSFKLPLAEAQNFASYTTLVIERGLAKGKTLKAVEGEIAAFAVIKLMKAEKVLKEILQQREAAKKKAEGKK